MDTMTAEKLKTVSGCFGNYPQTQALKSGQIKSDRIALQLTEVNPVYKAFFMMVRELRFDVSEMALVTYLQAKAYGVPIVLIPATMMGRFQHGTMLYNSERGLLTPDKLEGRRVGVRSFAQTTGCWVRGILWKDYGVDLSNVKWVTFEDAHMAEFKIRLVSSAPPTARTWPRWCSMASLMPRSSARCCRPIRVSVASSRIPM